MAKKASEPTKAPKAKPASKPAPEADPAPEAAAAESAADVAEQPDPPAADAEPEPAAEPEAEVPAEAEPEQPVDSEPAPEAPAAEPAAEVPAAPAKSAAVEPETVHVALLPVKLRQYRHVLERPFQLTKGASNLVAGGEVHAVKSIDYNPHTRRQEIVLADKVLLDDSELDQLLTKGWKQSQG